MRRAKYIIIDDGINETPIVFPEWVSHKGMALCLVGADGIAAGKVLSAGFVEFEVDRNSNVYCDVLGESTSLKLKPGEHDADLITRSLGMG